MKIINKETAIQKINTVGKVGHVISKIMMVFLIIGLAFSLIGGIILLAIPKDVFSFNLNADANVEVSISESDSVIGSMDNISEKISDGIFTINGVDYNYIEGSVKSEGNNIQMDYKGDVATITPRRVAAIVWTAFLYLAATLVLIIFIGRLCKAFKICSSPFEETIIKSLHNLAWSLIPWAFVGTFVKSIFNSAFNKTLNIGIGIDLTYILLILLVFGLAYIFKYGAILQTESDETL